MCNISVHDPLHLAWLSMRDLPRRAPDHLPYALQNENDSALCHVNNALV